MRTFVQNLDQLNMRTDHSIKKPGFWALSPLLVFLVFYLGTSILLNDFYKVPITIAFLVSSIYAILITPGLSVNERISRFSKGASDSNILLMIWIFVLAGAFAQSAKAMGAIDATVNLAILLLPGNLLLAGMFAAACFISMAIGTSVGTVVALVPVAAGIAGHIDISLPYLVAIVVGGAFFGDNLSFISDTTIAATRTQGCSMRDKFRVNIRIVLPAAMIVLLIYIFKGSGISMPTEEIEVNWIKVIPYLVVLITAICGLNVILVLILGLVVTGCIGISTGGYDFFGCLDAMGKGVTGMGELIIITLMAGGLLEIIRYNGGIEYVIQALTRRINSKRGAELAIAGLVSITNLCTANNTVAVITAGPIAKDISRKFHVDSRKSASILDTFSCLVQGLIPYGAQMLMAAGLASVSPVSIIQYLYYPFLMGLCALAAIFFRFPRKYS